MGNSSSVQEPAQTKPPPAVDNAAPKLGDEGLKAIEIDGKVLKPCCACPETKKARDAWYFLLLL